MSLKSVKDSIFKKRRILNPKNDADLVILLQRERAMTPPGYFERKVAEKAEKDMARAVREALGKGETPTVKSLTKSLDEHPLIAKFYADIGLGRDFFEGLAETAIEKKGESVKVTHEKIGRNAPCPCGSGKKYKRCCGGV